VSRVPDASEEMQDFFRAQNYREFLWFLWRGDYVRKCPVLLERNFVEKAESSYRDQYGTWSQLLVVGQIHLICAELVGPHLLR
jgi:hypothetical protein